MNYKKSKNGERSIRIIEFKKPLRFLLITALCSTFGLTAQTVPEPPTPPKTISTSGTSYSISIENDDDEAHNSSVSISKSDDSYKFRASFHQSKNQGVQALLLEKLGKGNLKINGNTHLWSENQNGEEIFECKLTKGHLRIYLDTKASSKGFMDKINTLGNDLKYYISGTDPEDAKTKAKEKAKRDIERAERDLERVKRDLERAERNSKRASENN
ncbi:MAG: hypothetical protein NWP87_03820 [Winogradskyella sp.]|nr:hypothetical protein [Winogradskyella sp.]